MIAAGSTPWTDVRDHIATGHTVAVLPFGALEQHGPQLPLATDTIQATGVAERIAERYDALLLPAVAYGDTWNNAGYPGTVSLSAPTVTAIAVDLARSVWSFGIKSLVIINGDWGNRNPLYEATRILEREHGIRILVLDYPGLTEAAEHVIESGPAAPGLCHADEIETSLVLALAPDQVHPDRYVACYPEFPADFGVRPMQLHQFSESGVFGDPTLADADKGRTLLEAVVTASVPIIDAYLTTSD